MDAELKAFYRPYIKRSLPPFWYFSGPIIIAIIILTAKYYGMKEQDKIRERIVQLEEGRIFDIKTDLGTYSTFKALKIEGDSVLLIYNLYSADYESGLEMIKEEENYKGVSQTVHRDQLLEWFDNGIIFHVHW